MRDGVNGRSMMRGFAMTRKNSAAVNASGSLRHRNPAAA
jgi:hypothetical protein